MFTAVLFTIADGWMEMWDIHTLEYHSALRMDTAVPSAATWMGLEMITLVKSVKDKHMLSAICGI